MGGVFKNRFCDPRDFVRFWAVFAMFIEIKRIQGERPAAERSNPRAGRALSRDGGDCITDPIAVGGGVGHWPVAMGMAGLQ